MHATKALGAPEVDAAQMIKAQLRLFRCQARLGKVPGCPGVAGVAGVGRLPPITEAARGDEDPCYPASAPMPGYQGGGDKYGGAKSDCVKRIEEMQRQREARRTAAAEAKVQRAAAVEDAQAMGGIHSVEFLQKIKAWRCKHRLPERPLPWADGDVWAHGDGSGIRVCVRKRPMLQGELRAHDFDVVSTGPGPARLTVHEPRTRVDLCKEVESHGFGANAGHENQSGALLFSGVQRPIVPHPGGPEGPKNHVSGHPRNDDPPLPTNRCGCRL